MKKKTFLAPLLLGIFVLTILSFVGAKEADAATNSEALSIVRNDEKQSAQINYYVPKNLQDTYTILVNGKSVSYYTSPTDYSADGYQNLGEFIKVWRVIPHMGAGDVVTLVNSKKEIIAQMMPPIDALPAFDAELSIVKNEENSTSQINIVKNTSAIAHYEVLLNGKTLFESNKDVHKNATGSQYLSDNKTKIWKLTQLKVGDHVRLITMVGNVIKDITVTQDMVSTVPNSEALSIVRNDEKQSAQINYYVPKNMLDTYTILVNGKSVSYYTSRTDYSADGYQNQGEFIKVWRVIPHMGAGDVVTLVNSRDITIAQMMPPIDALPAFDAELSIVKNEENSTSQINIVKNTSSIAHYEVLVNGKPLFESNKDVHKNATGFQYLSDNKTKIWKLTPLKVGDHVRLITMVGNVIKDITVTQDMVF